LQRAVGVRLIRHGVDETHLEQTRRSDREEREEEEPDPAGDEERVAE
jgi:hypothetical protein